MVGLTHVALRMTVREYLPANANTIWPTEMLNSRRLPDEDLTQTPESMRAAAETGLVPQILGNEEKFISPSVKKLIDWGAEAIDINMGCPVEKALKHNYGVSLMGDSDYAASVVEMTVRNSSVPVSVKFRSTNEADELLKFVDSVVQAGASWVTLHPRTAAQKRRGNADWSQVKLLKQHVKVPVIGNGDIQTADDVEMMLDETGCDLVMSGRALAARPWMLWQLGEKWGFENPVDKSGLAPRTSVEEGAEYGKVLHRLLDYSLEFFPEQLALRKFRFHVRTTSVWLPFGHSLYADTTKAKNAIEMRERLRRFFDREIEMSARTDLRQ